MTLSRREFLAGLSAASAVWLAGAAACRVADPDAKTHAAPPESLPDASSSLVHFSPDDADDVEAITARIFPTDETPGAREAGCVYFIDRSLATFASDQAELFAEGISALNAAVNTAYPGRGRFAELTDAEQDVMLRGIQDSPFFGSVRFATIAGMFALPKYGGNRDFIGWQLVNQQHVMEYQPPFGWYDQPENQRALLGRLI